MYKIDFDCVCVCVCEQCCIILMKPVSTSGVCWFFTFVWKKSSLKMRENLLSKYTKAGCFVFVRVIKLWLFFHHPTIPTWSKEIWQSGSMSQVSKLFRCKSLLWENHLTNLTLPVEMFLNEVCPAKDCYAYTFSFC